MENFKKQIGEKIMQRRVELGLNQSDLAKSLKVDRSRISHWENGKILPSKKYREGLAKHLKTSANDLFGDAPTQSFKDDEPFDVWVELISNYRSSGRATRAFVRFVLSGEPSHLDAFDSLRPAAEALRLKLEQSP